MFLITLKNSNNLNDNYNNCVKLTVKNNYTNLNNCLALFWIQSIEKLKNNNRIPTQTKSHIIEDILTTMLPFCCAF